ncbi:MAG: hypothetical protein PF482_06605 [Desulfobacteraceae bacterium]|nr:hypothetical protein [Desulfobacteraceae bacterium]
MPVSDTCKFISIVYGNSTFIAIGQDEDQNFEQPGIIITTTDNGETWTAKKDLHYSMNSISYGNDKFVISLSADDYQNEKYKNLLVSADGIE